MVTPRFLWGIGDTNPNPEGKPAAENQAFVRRLVHATLSDAHGYVEGLGAAAVDVAVNEFGGGRWPFDAATAEATAAGAAAEVAAAESYAALELD